MSTPPLSVLAIAANYRCSHCDNDPVLLTQDEHGTWHLGIRHDDGCPVLAGALSDLPDTIRAAVRNGGRS
jgi:hypothetical protein